MKIIGSKLQRASSSWRHSYKLVSGRVYSKVLSHFISSSSYSCTNGRVPPSLYKQVSISDQTVLITPILDQWVQDNNQLSLDQLSFLVTRFRSFKRFSHALQVSEWMSKNHSTKLMTRHRAHQMDLISAVRGLDQAEKFFHELPSSLRSPRICSTLLKCYADAKCLKKAEIFMEKLKSSGFAENRHPYNIMLKMYFQLELYDKVERLLEEMEKKGFISDTWTYRIQLNAYSSCGNVKEMDMLLMKMEADPAHTMAASDYITAASGYLKAGSVEKFLSVLRLAERLARDKTKKLTFECLLTLYARAQLKEEVIRLWNIYKRSWKGDNKGYHVMVSSLVILNELEEAEKIADEWVKSISGNRPLDMRVINSLVQAYGKKGDFEKAEELINKFKERCMMEPKRSTLCTLADNYLLHNRMEDAVKTLKTALQLKESKWKPHNSVVVKYLNYLKGKGNSVEFLEFACLLEENGYIVENLFSDHSEDSKKQSDFYDEANLEDIELQKHDSMQCNF